jgi:sensor histidine kinase YesM
MNTTTRGKLIAIILIVLVASVALVSCSQGVPVEDAREMQQEIISISDRVSQIESSLLDLKDEEMDTGSAEMQMVIDEMIDELRTISTRMAEIEAKLDFPEPEQTEPGMDTGPSGGMAPAPGF